MSKKMQMFLSLDSFWRCDNVVRVEFGEDRNAFVVYENGEVDEIDMLELRMIKLKEYKEVEE